MFRSAVDLAFDVQFGHLVPDLGHYFVEKFLPFPALFAYALRYVLVLVGVQVHHCEVFELAFEEGYSQSARKRRVNIQRFARYILLFFGGKVFERPHVVKAVGKFHDDDAQVLRKCHEELAEVLRLRLFAVGELQFVEFRDALDEFENFLPEFRGELFRRDGRVFEHVVQERGDDRGTVKPEIRKNFHDGARVNEIVFTRTALLPLVGGLCEFVGFFYLGVTVGISLA